MAKGKLVADVIEHSSVGSVDTQYVVNGSAKVIFCMNLQGTAALESDAGGAINTSSLVDNGTGDGTVSYTSSLSGRKNPVSHDDTGNTGGGQIYARTSQVVNDFSADGFVAARTGSLTGSIRIHSYYTSDAASGMHDYATNFIVIHGDLA